MWFLWVSVLGYEWVGVFLLVKIAEGMVHLSVLTLICTDCCTLAKPFVN